MILMDLGYICIKNKIWLAWLKWLLKTVSRAGEVHFKKMCTILQVFCGRTMLLSVSSPIVWSRYTIFKPIQVIIHCNHLKKVSFMITILNKVVLWKLQVIKWPYLSINTFNSSAYCTYCFWSCILGCCWFWRNYQKWGMEITFGGW